MKRYDYIIAGGGLSGMMLAYYLSQSHLKNKRVLLIEKDLPGKYTREWSYWIDHQHPFAKVVAHQWNALSGYFDNSYFHFPLQKYQIQLLRSEDLFTFIFQQLSVSKNFECVYETVKKAEESTDAVTVTTSCSTFTGKWLFNSILTSNKYVQTANSMSGCSWILETETTTFNPTEMVFCDYRYSLPEQPGFFYLLPVSATKAIIYYASFSRHTMLTKKSLTNEVKKYISKFFCLKQYSLRSRELSNYPLVINKKNRDTSSRIVPIGAAAGMIKPSSSYGFTNILHDSESMVKSLVQNDHPFYPSTSNLLSTLSDAAMANMVQYYPKNISQLFISIFKSLRSGDDLLTFLDEKASFKTQLQIMKSVNPKLFFSEDVTSIAPAHHVA